MINLITNNILGILNFLISFKNFWPNFIADSLVAFLSFLLIKIFTPIFNRPKLKMVIKQDGLYRKNILFFPSPNGIYEADIILAIKNEGKKTFKSGEGYWHAYIKTDTATPFSAIGEKNHERGLINGSIYPGSFLDTEGHYKFSINKEDIDIFNIPCFLSTDYGYFPKTVTLNGTTGKIMFKNMDSIGYEIKQ